MVGRPPSTSVHPTQASATSNRAALANKLGLETRPIPGIEPSPSSLPIRERRYAHCRAAATVESVTCGCSPNLTLSPALLYVGVPCLADIQIDSQRHSEMSATDPADTHTFVRSSLRSDARQAAVADACGAMNLTELAPGR